MDSSKGTGHADAGRERRQGGDQVSQSPSKHNGRGGGGWVEAAPKQGDGGREAAAGVECWDLGALWEGWPAGRT